MRGTRARCPHVLAGALLLQHCRKTVASSVFLCPRLLSPPEVRALHPAQGRAAGVPAQPPGCVAALQAHQLHQVGQPGVPATEPHQPGAGGCPHRQALMGPVISDSMSGSRL